MTEDQIYFCFSFFESQANDIFNKLNNSALNLIHPDPEGRVPSASVHELRFLVG